MITVAIKNLSNVVAAMKRKSAAIDRAIARGTFRAATMIQGRARERVKEPPKSGRQYGRHRASAPGESPAGDLGHLARSIVVVRGETVNGKCVCEVVAGAPYAKMLEYGTRGRGAAGKKAGRGRQGRPAGGRIEPRPFMAPAVREKTAEANKVIKQEIDRELSK